MQVAGERRAVRRKVAAAATKNTDSKATEDEEEFPGEVLLARWLPDLVAYGGSIDDSDDEADDEIAFKQAEYMLHRGGVDAEDDTGDGDGIEGGGGGGPSGSKHSGGMHAEAGVAAMGSAPRTNHLMNSSALRMVHRTGSLLDLRGGLRNDMDSELLDAMCEGRLDPSQDVNRIIGTGWVWAPCRSTCRRRRDAGQAGGT